MNFTDDEMVALRALMKRLASLEGEDIIGIIMKNTALHRTRDPHYWHVSAVVALAKKLE